MTEKRSYRRYPIWFPVTLKLSGIRDEAEKPGQEVWAICRDASARGVLVSAVKPIDVGSIVDACFRVRGEAAIERTVRARVVREEPPEEELTLVFPHRFALEFEEAVQPLAEELSAYSEKVLTR